MTVPTGHPFLVRYLHIIKATKLMKNLASYYMERMLQEYSTLSYRPSLVAAAAVCLAMNNPDVLEYESAEEDSAPGVVSTIFLFHLLLTVKTKRATPSNILFYFQPESIVAYSGYRREEIMEVAGYIASKVSEEITSYSRRELVSVKRKYEADQYDNAATSFVNPNVSHIATP
jgi:hypothetical protein